MTCNYCQSLNRRAPPATAWCRARGVAHLPRLLPCLCHCIRPLEGAVRAGRAGNREGRRASEPFGALLRP